MKITVGTRKIRMIGRPTPKITINHIMTFGKHKGLSLKSLLDVDPGYIVWLKEEAVLNIPDDIYNQAIEKDMENDDYGFDNGWSTWMDEPF